MQWLARQTDRHASQIIWKGRSRVNRDSDALREAREYAAAPLPAQTPQRTTPKALIALGFRERAVHDSVHATSGGTLLQPWARCGRLPGSCLRQLQGAEGDKILYVFDCGGVGDASQIELRDGELDQWKWVPVNEIANYAIPRLARRLTHAYEARHTETPLYLEHGAPALG